MTASCYCKSCQEAGRRFESAAVLDADGGTGVVLYRKDRVRCLSGSQHLEERRLKPDSATRRILATCCNTPMFLDFTKGHWLALYRNRFGTDAPPLEMRIMTNERPSGVELPDDVPSYGGHSGKFFRKLVRAWIAMGFRRPIVALGRPA